MNTRNRTTAAHVADESTSALESALNALAFAAIEKGNVETEVEDAKGTYENRKEAAMFALNAVFDFPWWNDKKQLSEKEAALVEGARQENVKVWASDEIVTALQLQRISEAGYILKEDAEGKRILESKKTGDIVPAEMTASFLDGSTDEALSFKKAKKNSHTRASEEWIRLRKFARDYGKPKPEKTKKTPYEAALAKFEGFLNAVRKENADARLVEVAADAEKLAKKLGVG